MAGAEKKTKTSKRAKAPKPRGRGRPVTKPKGFARKASAEVKMGPVELAWIDAKASELGTSRSTYCYEAVVERMKRDGFKPT